MLYWGLSLTTCLCWLLLPVLTLLTWLKYSYKLKLRTVFFFGRKRKKIQLLSLRNKLRVTSAAPRSRHCTVWFCVSAFKQTLLGRLGTTVEILMSAGHPVLPGNQRSDLSEWGHRSAALGSWLRVRIALCCLGGVKTRDSGGGRRTVHLTFQEESVPGWRPSAQGFRISDFGLEFAFGKGWQEESVLCCL